MVGEMKVLIKKKEGASYEYTDMQIPEPSEDELLVKVLRVSICGSDIALYHWNEIAKGIASLPFIPGHECVGEIVKVGAKCGPEYQVGQRVCCENHFYCGKCYQCLHDQRHICQNMSQYGHGKGTIHGGFSQFTIIPARYAYKLKTDIDSELACILEPIGVSHQAVEKLQPQGDTVLVQGCGAIGLYAIAICKYMGAKKILATDIVQGRLEMAQKMGADVLINGKVEDLKSRVMEETNGDGVGRLVEASGAQPLVNNCFQLLRKGGTIVCIGIAKAPLHVENFPRDILFKSLSLHTVHGRKLFSTWEQSEQLVFNRHIDVVPTISHTFPMSRFEEAFAVLFSGDCCKILIDPQS